MMAKSKSDTSENMESWTRSFYKTVSLASEDPEFTMMSNRDRIKSVLNHLCENNITSILTPDIENKNSNVAAEFRSKGNKYFTSKGNGRLDRAFEEYTKSMAYSLPKSQELSLAHANRSAVLFEAGLISDCLRDVDRAFENGYPDNLKAQLYLRKAMCLRAMNRDDGIVESSDIKKALVGVQEWMTKMDDKKRKVIEEKLSDQMKVIPIDKTTFFTRNSQDSMPTLKAENSMIPGLSDAVELKWSEKFGRHFVASRDIKPGEILVMRKPYAKVISPKMRYRICWNCGRQAWASEPCDDCPHVIYCTDICKQNAKFEHHQFECPIIGQIIQKCDTPTTLSMGLRLTVKALTEAGGSFRKLAMIVQGVDAVSDPLKKGFTNDVLDEKKFASVCGLTYNPEEFKTRKSTFLVKPIITAFQLATRTDLFGSRKNLDLTKFKDDEDFIFLVQLIERNCQLATNYSLEIAIPDKKCKQSVQIFHVTEPVLCIFNHSCNPTLTRSLNDEFVVSTAIQNIKRGQQIFDNYGMSFMKLEKTERQAHLFKKFHFTCDCEACKNDWPMKIVPTSTKRDGQYMKIAQGIAQFASDLEELKETKDFSIKGKKYSIYNLKTDISKVLNAISNFSSNFEKNSVEVIGVILLLREYLRFTENRFVSLD